MSDYVIGKILDIAIGVVLMAVLVASGLLVWSYVEPDDSMAVSGNGKGHARKGHSHPLVDGMPITATNDAGCLRCHHSLP